VWHRDRIVDPNDGEAGIQNLQHMTAREVAEILAAILGFVPLTVCFGYLAAWYSDLFQFRQRTVVERIFWSVPLSLAVSTISGFWISRFVSVTAAAVFFLGIAALWLATVTKEWLDLRRAGRRLHFGWQPHGTAALLLACFWIAIAVASLVDIVTKDHRLFMCYAMWDQGQRINWSESILRTGVPPINSFYLYGHPFPLRNYYFWYLDCALVARMWQIPVRAVFAASSVWAGFSLTALCGLCLKHLLEAGPRLRRQFLVCAGLLGVTGLDIFAILWTSIFMGKEVPLDFEAWSTDKIASWTNSLIWAPHHVSAMVCCLFAFLLAWIAGRADRRRQWMAALFIGAAMASAFGLSVFVSFAFFLLMVGWGLWQIAVERAPRPVWYLAAGGLIAGALISPYLWDVSRTPSQVQGGSIFKWTVREMLPPDYLLALGAFQHLAMHHPAAARHLANLILLLPGYGVELGFYAIAFVIFLIPAWRGRKHLSDGERALVCLSLTILPVLTFLRSAVIENNDFGWRAALFLQFPLLLLGSALIVRWKDAGEGQASPSADDTATPGAPRWLRQIAWLALSVGIVSTVCQMIVLRVGIRWYESHQAVLHHPDPERFSRSAYISAIGYSELNARIPRDAVVQFETSNTSDYYGIVDLMWVNHQTAISGDKNGCGSVFGGDPRGCAILGPIVDGLYRDATAGQARGICRQLGIQYLVVRVYDPAWADRESWVWTLPPVVADPEFRALDCR
jgi:hypothetical protein